MDALDPTKLPGCVRLAGKEKYQASLRMLRLEFNKASAVMDQKQQHLT